MKGKKYKIRHGSFVEFQHRVIVWPPFPAADVAFSVLAVPPALGATVVDAHTVYSCRAFGFGQLGSGEMAYGSGPVLVRGMENLYESD